MLFHVMSFPATTPTSALVDGRRAFRAWLQALLNKGIARHPYARVGRGAIVVFEVESHEALHALLNQWTEFVPARFEVTAIAPWTVEGRGLPPLPPAAAG